jgi:2-oxoglutarate ferredoxin oxidoreductase subunit alpha
VKLLLGNEAVAAGAIAGGATFYAGFPLPPSSEIDAALLAHLPGRGGSTVLAEDAPAAVGAVLGAAAGGTLGVTALTAGALAAAEELIRFGIESKLPALLAVVGSRPESARRLECASQHEAVRLRIATAEGEATPVWAPASSDECFALTRAAAGEARHRGTPVLVYVDDVVAHLREPVATDDGDSRPGAPAPVELFRTRDATVLVVAFGIVARAARSAVRMAREQGIRAGLFRPVRLWPFPHAELQAAAARAGAVLVAELNEGQLLEVIASQLGASGPDRGIRGLSETTEGMITPARILELVREAA